MASRCQELPGVGRKELAEPSLAGGALRGVVCTVAAAAREPEKHSCSQRDGVMPGSLP